MIRRLSKNKIMIRYLICASVICVACAICAVFSLLNVPVTFRNISKSQLAQDSRRDEKTDGDNTPELFGIDIRDLRSRSYTQSEPFTYLDEYKNPCWLEHLTPSFLQDYHATPFHEYAKAGISVLRRIYTRRLEGDLPWRLRCLPYFYLVGVTKCGTTDLYNAITRHPHVHGAWVKEPMYWNRRRYPAGVRVHKDRYVKHTSFSKYVNMFDHGAHLINESHTSEQLILGDGSSYLLWEDDGWESHHGNYGLLEPRYTTAMALYAAQPNAKLIVLLRNPTDRLYSAFTMYPVKSKYSKSPETFDVLVEDAVRKYNDCLRIRTLRSCVYNVSLYLDTFPITLRASMYSTHLRDWLSVFDRRQLLILKSENYYQDRIKSLTEVFKFLDLDVMDKRMERALRDKGATFGQKYKPMLARTRQALETFFKPFNKQLENMLNTRFWS